MLIHLTPKLQAAGCELHMEALRLAQLGPAYPTRGPEVSSDLLIQEENI